MDLRVLALIACMVFGIISAGCTTTPSPGTPTVTPTATATTVVTTVPTTTPPLTTITPVNPASSPLVGTWYFQEMIFQDAPAPLTVEDVQITTTFSPTGTVSGYAGCNNYEATYSLTGQSTPVGNGLVIGQITTPGQYCSTTGDTENSFLGILGNAEGYVVYPQQVLFITDKDGNSLSFARTPYSSPGQSIPLY